MKDRVFIAWSGTNEIALGVKKILEQKHNYVCCIGGNSDNDSTFASVGDTVLQQIKSCNQAIVIVQNKENGMVSNNLFFELGYVLAKYGTKKVHCVKRLDEVVLLPSDFDNSFIESINDGGDKEILCQKIVEYFMGRQKMTVEENKIFLINNRYLMHEKIKSHYSDNGSMCSDYELAQYMLFYTQAAHLFGDEEKVFKELVEFKNRHNYEFSDELLLSVNMGLNFLNMVLSIKFAQESHEVYIEQDVFQKTREAYKQFREKAKPDDIGAYHEWVNLFISEQMAFMYMLFACHPQNDMEMKGILFQKSEKEGRQALNDIDSLELSMSKSKDNNDKVGLISLLKAYIFRNIYLAREFLKQDDSLEWLEKTLKERRSLKNVFDKGTIDTKLYDNFEMEYYLALISCLDHAEQLDIDILDVKMYRKDIKQYLERVRIEENKNQYIRQIDLWDRKQL